MLTTSFELNKSITCCTKPTSCCLFSTWLLSVPFRILWFSCHERHRAPDLLHLLPSAYDLSSCKLLGTAIASHYKSRCAARDTEGAPSRLEILGQSRVLCALVQPSCAETRCPAHPGLAGGCSRHRLPFHTTAEPSPA